MTATPVELLRKGCISKTAWVRTINAITVEFTKALGPELAGIDEQAIAIGQFIASKDFGCKTSTVRDLVSLLLGKAIPEFESGSKDYPAGMCVVPLNANNGHDYDLNTPCLVIEQGSRAMEKDGSTHNHLPAMDPAFKDIRPATADEIKTFFESLSKRALGKTIYNIFY